jgi:hypothetical protein
VDGIQLGIRVAKGRYETGDKLVPELWARNVTDKALLWDTRFPVVMRPERPWNQVDDKGEITFIVREAADNELGGVRMFLPRLEPNKDTRLETGGRLEAGSGLAEALQFGDGAVGGYAVSARFSGRVGGNEQVWTTGRTQIEVAAPTTKAGVIAWGRAVDGIELGIRVPTGRYALGGTLAAELWARNVTDAPLTWQHWEMLYWNATSVWPTANDSGAIAFRWAGSMPPGNGVPTTTVLPPNKETKVRDMVPLTLVDPDKNADSRTTFGATPGKHAVWGDWLLEPTPGQRGSRWTTGKTEIEVLAAQAATAPLTFTLSGDELTRIFAAAIPPREFDNLNGIIHRVFPLGAPKRIVHVTLDNAKLLHNGLTGDDIRRALETHNLKQATSEITAERTLLRFEPGDGGVDLDPSIHELEAVVLKGTEGIGWMTVDNRSASPIIKRMTICLSDLGTVTESFDPPATQPAQSLMPAPKN